ncbi:hypothetical protein RQP46_003714 [Phenoliferia psychrophenolica]
MSAVNTVFIVLSTIMFVMNISPFIFHIRRDQRNYAVIFLGFWTQIFAFNTIVNMAVWHNDAALRLPAWTVSGSSDCRF